LWAKMRIMIKGGVWKNTEDEILKAAVMKYGKNQWARISSLLVRKSAKQCKARWYEWLDPSIKKTEWTREEDEKLLHLAKLMPTQWRTIAPIVGRTPAQCLERYEKLLDAACAKDDNYDPADDPRRLRPGEIDPNPESKPARPDPVDMDEDEKEMLSEARARLANTRGKKAKRKAREKALEEARRLAHLQKTRELKAAGIELRGRYKKKKGIDYNAEVAFEKRAPHGFYDTSQEAQLSKELGKEFRPVTLEELEGKRRKDIEENLQKQDVKRQKMQARNNAPAAVAKNLAMNEVNPMEGVRRSKMMLPAPQISESELETIARMESESGPDPEMAEGAGGEVTRALLGNYKETPRASATPMRTPRTPALGYDSVLQQAENLAKMTALNTPLEGGVNPELHPSDFTGATPKTQVQSTPNLMATPLRTPAPGATPQADSTPSQRAGRAIAGVAATPASVASTPSRGTAAHAQHRDELGLNDPAALMPYESGKAAQRAAAAMARNELLAGLSQLPEPQNEYQIMVPEMPEEELPEQAIEEDAADARERLRREAEAARQRELKKRSQVLQRGLPRPHLDHREEGIYSDENAGSTNPKLLSAAKMIEEEMASIIKHDSLKYPIKDEKEEKKRKKADQKREAAMGASVELEAIPDEDIESAKELISAEVEFLRSAMGHGAAVSDSAFSEVWGAAVSDVIYLPSNGKAIRASSATNTDRVASLQAEFESVRTEMAREASRAAKLEKKVSILTGAAESPPTSLRGN